MSVAGISSATNSYAQGVASDGDSGAVEAKESTATKLSEQQNGGKATSVSTGQQSSSANNLAKLRTFANQHMPVSQIAQRLGISVSTVMQEASAAGINLSTGNSSRANANPAVGNNVNKIV
jgi:hypothetical protein